MSPSLPSGGRALSPSGLQGLGMRLSLKLPYIGDRKREQVVKNYFAGVNEKDKEKIAACFADNNVISDVMGTKKGALVEADGKFMADRVGDFLAAHPDAKVMFREGAEPRCTRGTNWVWCHWYEEGSWSGESLGIKPDGSPLDVQGHTRFYVGDEGKIEKVVVFRTFSAWELAAAGRKDVF
eukprot:CAMPEP_0184321370 /NCGR_PEP_ID=MMETSP1049-20130417/118700_1 /TAXON_ID=77928 /ORGANISM="Proteomonas sulcata, Strain CCMP704" /LENGTH=180 /DNA_ID=CAMNT_0026642163 /DNA_START=87 /DNA_END=629 /DNA_ORIENTATION=-